MRLHRIALRNFRGVATSEVILPTEGVVIIEGPNEVGKTSLAEAVVLVIGSMDSSTAAAIKSVQTVGLDEGPEVEIELSTGPYRFVLAKRWLRQKRTTLHILEPRPEQLSGRDAHDRVQAILNETADLELWSALRLDQGSDTSQAAFDVPSLARALEVAAAGPHDGDADAAEGADGADGADSGDDLFDKVEKEWLRYFTATGQDRRDRVVRRAELAEADAVVRRLTEEAAALDVDARTVEALTTELADLHVARTAAEATVTRHQADLVAVQAADAEVERTAAALDSAERALVHARAASEQRTDLAAEVARLTLDHADAERSHAESMEALAGHTARLAEAIDVVTRAEAVLVAAEQDAVEARADRDHLHRSDEHHRLVEQRQRVELSTEELADAERVLQQIAVTDDLVRELQEAHVAVATAEAVAAAGAASVVLESLDPEAAAGVLVDGVPVPDLAAGPHTESVPDEVRIEVPGHLRLTVRAGAEARQAATRLTAARARSTELCLRAGVTDLDHARAELARRDDALARRRRATATISEVLGDRPVEVVRDRIDRLADQLDADAALFATRVQAGQLPADLAAADTVVHDAEQTVRLARTARQRAVDAVDRETEAGSGNRHLEIELRLREEHLASTLASVSARLASQRDDEPDEILTKLVVEAEIAQATALAAAEAAIAQRRLVDRDGVDTLLENAQAGVERLAREIGACEDRRRDLRAWLEAKGETDLSARRNEAMSRAQHLRHDVERTDERAAAAAMLRASFVRRREEAHRRYVAPFRDRLLSLGRLVFGPDLDVELGPDLRITHRTLGGVTLPFDQLSVGAREQLGILSRLACAGIVSGSGGAPVMFDDALGWTDPDRLERMGAAIATAGRDCQVVIFTCTPGRYRSVGNAQVIRLPG